MGEFRPSLPGERRGGRSKGTPNKATADIKSMILGALSDVGGRDYLAQQARINPGPFLTLVGKVLPMQISGDPDRPVAISFTWADALPAAPTTIDAVPEQEPQLQLEVTFETKSDADSE